MKTNLTILQIWIPGYAVKGNKALSSFDEKLVNC